MPRIDQKRNYFKDHYFFFFGLLWLLMGLVMLLITHIRIYIAYFPLGLGMIIYGKFNTNKHSAFIEWDENSITVKEWTEKKISYTYEEIDQIIISKGHLTIKSGPANGIMVELKDYRKEDLDFLQKSLPSFPSAR